MKSISVQTPVGGMTLTQEGDYITALDWGRSPAHSRSPLLDEAIAQLTAYFDGTLRRFDLPLAAKSTAFAHGVNEALLSIPFGETRTYGEIAKQLEAPAQSIGQACGANPIAIFIPCHRVVGANSLGGYSGRHGIESKVFLLRHEGAASLLL